MCKSQIALLRGLRPSTQKTTTYTCSSNVEDCIFCSIWQLSSFVTSRIPLTQRYPTLTSYTPNSPLPRSNSIHHESDTYDWESSVRVIEAHFQSVRTKLNSIMSICTVEGAEDSEGLYIAYERCLNTVEDLVYQENVLEKTLVKQQQQQLRQQWQWQLQRTQQQQQQSLRSSKGRSINQVCGLAREHNWEGRKPSLTGLAM